MCFFINACAYPEICFIGGPTLTAFFFVDEGREDSNATIGGPSSARQRSAIEVAFRWRADGGPTLNAGLVALWFYRGSGPVLLRNSIFCDF